MKFYVTSRISENMHETPEGYLVCIGVPIARTGEMEYADGETPLEVGDDGKCLISRSEDEVFRPETIASFEGKAVTIGHPNEFVGPNNWKELAKGSLQNVRRGEGDLNNSLLADLLITDSVAINLVKNGLREVSCGYEAVYTQTGEGRGSQSKLVGNHLALVEQGRAGSAYAINDHKGKDSKMKLKDKIKAIFAKAQDEALALATDESAEEKPAKKEESGDEGGSSYDELVKMVKDLSEKVSSLVKPKDESTEPTENKPAEVDAKDQEEEEAAPAEKSLEDRLNALEMAVAKLLEHESEEGELHEEMGDEDESDEEESEDEMEGDMVGDTASRIEILAPGLKATGKDAKAKAIKTAYATKDGKAVIDQLTGGKAPDLKDENKVNTLFIAASELLKSHRSSEMSKTKQTRDFSSGRETPKGAMTAEQLNEINAKHYGSK